MVTTYPIFCLILLLLKETASLLIPKVPSFRTSNLHKKSFHNHQLLLNRPRSFYNKGKTSKTQGLFGLGSSLISSLSNENKKTSHNVDGIECIEISIPLNSTLVPFVTILEATASSQEDLVNVALTFDDESSEDFMNENSKEAVPDLDLNAGDPYGAVLWPASSAIAEHMLESVTSLHGLTVLELGAGTGLVSIVAAMAGANRVLATDYEPIPLKLLHFAAENLNSQQSDSDEPEKLSSVIETFHFDMCDKNTPLPPADIVVASDIMYEPHTGKAMAHRTLEALRRKSRVIIGDSPGRPGRPAFLKELELLGVVGPQVNFQQKKGRTCSGERHDLICGEGSTSVSDQPKDLDVAVMDLNPDLLMD